MAALMFLGASAALANQSRRPVDQVPAQVGGAFQVALTGTYAMDFPQGADSNSPAFWDGGVFYLFNSSGGQTWRSTSLSSRAATQPTRVTFTPAVAGSIWLEAVVYDESSGILYGYYHNEVSPTSCPSPSRTVPRIGAARSFDRGLTWMDLGIVLEADARDTVCDSENFYFSGGHGDFSVMLDDRRQYLYFAYTNYSGAAPSDVTDQVPTIEQGVALARMPWAERDVPVQQVVKDGITLNESKVRKYYQGSWDGQPGLGGAVEPLFPARISWNKINADSLWGPSIHWNTHLNRYVMLLERAIDSSSAWRTEGVYVSYSSALDEPDSWSEPVRILQGGGWYAQVIGEPRDRGTDKTAGQHAAFYMSGGARATLTFYRPGETRACPPEGAPVDCRPVRTAVPRQR